MKKYLLFLTLFISSVAYADITTPLEFTEEDGSPSTYPYKIKFSNTSITDNLDGTITVSTGGGSGEVNTASNLGNGIGWFSDKSVADLRFKSIVSGDNIVVTQDATSVRVSTTGLAPSTADYLVGTANGSLSAEIVVGTSPGGELGGTWASPTLDDNVTVTGWVMGASTATTPSANDDDTSLATTAYVQTEINAMGGRSLTASSGSMDADAELYTKTICYRLPANPVAGDDDKSIWINDTANTFTVTKLWAESDQTVTLMLQVDDGSPADMDSVDLIAVTTPDTDTSLDGDATIAPGDRVDVDVASVSGSPTWCTICFTGTWDD